MYQTLLSDKRLWHLLFRIDEELADSARRAGCGCGGRLHSARYPRKPRGGELGPDSDRRLSFCCDQANCRRRTTPPSVRFLGRKVYARAVVVVVSALEGQATAAERNSLLAELGISPRTFSRWHRWWREAFAQSPFWRAAQGRFHLPVPARELPRVLLERLRGTALDRLSAVLRFIAPLTTTSGLAF